LQVIEHAPSAQLAVPFVLEHAVPHAPQFAALVCVFTSQPFAGLPSQLPNPAPQVPSVQVPEAHDSLAFAKSQSAPQVPQFVSVVRFVSQPFPALPSQLPKPVVQPESWHAPARHVGLPFVKLHTWPQVPQFPELVPVLVSQPFATLPSQLPNPAVHAIEHAPALHDGVPLALEHAAPQVPQFPVLVFVLVSQPFPLLPSQLPNPALHPTSWHVPVEQDAVAFA